LSLQQEIEALERELDELDEFDAVGEGQEKKLQCWARDARESRKCDVRGDFPYERTRPEVLLALRLKLIEYGDSSHRGRGKAND
jgi:hypothetical protein